MQNEYREFLLQKAQSDHYAGFDPVFMPDFLFDFQRSLVEWSVKKGKSAVFADCGLGKTPMQLIWAENIVRKTNCRVLLLTPLAMSYQTIEEAEKFGIEAHRTHEGELYDGINVTNYERLHYYDPKDFAGVACDESSILKSFDGKTKAEVTWFMRKLDYRSLWTATAAPNDHIELGTSSEALGELGAMDMLNRFFKNDQNNSSTKRLYGEAPKWRFKAHSEIPFWRWVTSWARACRKPSDLGFDDGRFVLPKLTEEIHTVKAETLPVGLLFEMPAITLDEQRDERRRTLKERAEKVAELVDHKEPSLIWCHLNEEGTALAKIVPDSVEISGRDSDESKERKFIAFKAGEIKNLITKPKIGAWGLNFQHCAHVVFYPSHSYEQYYQGVRRCWRFGQTKPVKVDIVTTEGELRVMQNLQRKSAQADKMFESLVEEMHNAIKVRTIKKFDKIEEIPAWL